MDEASPMSPAIVATTPPATSQIVLFVGAPVKMRDMSFANE